MGIPYRFDPLGTLGNIEILDSVLVPRLSSAGTIRIGETAHVLSAENFRCGIEYSGLNALAGDVTVLGTQSYITNVPAGAVFYLFSVDEMSLVNDGEVVKRFDARGKNVVFSQTGRQGQLFVDGTLVHTFTSKELVVGQSCLVSVRQSEKYSFVFKREWVADGDRMLVDLVPARRADGTLGIYNAVNGRFYEFAS